LVPVHAGSLCGGQRHRTRDSVGLDLGLKSTVATSDGISMLLAQIEVENFKGLHKATFEPGNFSCLVGENNAGKSSVLQAIAYILNRPNQLQLSLYYDPSKPVIFRGHFTGVTPAHLDRLADEHRQKLSPLVIDETYIPHFADGKSRQLCRGDFFPQTDRRREVFCAGQIPGFG
jgi:predicted ATP-dependent endonuclease of OLD family